MKLRPKNPPAKSSQTLIVTLAILVVVTIAIASTLALVELDSQSTKNSSQQTQSSLMALNAVSLIEGDLKQEIINGSTLIPTTNGTYQLYYPTGPTNMLVVRNTTSNAQTNILNLIRGSYRSDPIGFPGVSSMASAVNSSTDPSYDGRVVSLASWNAHYLVPRLNAGASTPPASLDSTPIAAFTAPDWVYVSGAGNREVISTPDKTVVGRYAYTVYDEGGLLDANVVGMPSSMGSSQLAQKNSAAFADLNKLPYLGQTNIDNLVGWRNYYTTKPSGSFPSYTISSSSSTNYFNYLNNATNGFLAVNPAPPGTTATDQSFPSRQALIAYCRSTGISVDALQYLATHTRDLNQPSYIPNPNRPKVVSPGTLSSGSWTISTYMGGNDGYTFDNAINPPFLAITAQSAFKRNDGSTAVIGEPLVKKRFDLRRLAWLTYKGPSSSRTLSDPDMAQVQANGVTAAFLQLGTPQNVYNYFGLTWNGQNWVYNHGSTSGAIYKLANVSALPSTSAREPDFFELLKAAINVGSVGKSCAYGSSIDTGFYQHQIDISVDNQIIQIGANIMDQSDADGYPTDISFNGLDIYGVENLPYLYRTTYSWAYNASNPVSIKSPTPSVPSSGIESDTTPTSLQNGGEADFYLIPHMWNMCDQNDITVRTANYALGNPRPGSGQLRITATTAPPGGASAYWQLGFEFAGINDAKNSNNASNLINYMGGSIINNNAVPIPQPTTNPLVGESLTFGDFNGSLFREPTMLWRLGYPAGSGLTSNTTAVYDVFDLKNSASAPKRVGFYLNSAPVVWTYTDGGNAYLTQGRGLCYLSSKPSGSVYGYSGAMTYLSQYQNSSGAWQTYDTRYWDLQGREPDYASSATGSELNLVYNGSIYYNGQQFARFFPASSGSPSPADTGEYEGDDTMGFDCRSDRWGLGESNGSSITALDYSITSPFFCVNPTDRPGYTANDAQANDTNSGVHIGNFEPGGALATAVQTYGALFYDTKGYYLGSNNTAPYGMWSQNSPWAISTPTGGQGGGIHHCFNADADAVVRRAMGAYVSVSLTSPSTPTALGLPMATATSFSGSGVGSANTNGQSASRPIILNRPFQTVNELSYVFKGTPFKNLDFSTPESGDSALLDVFCVGDVSSSNGLEAGRVNLNTRQIPVLQALLNNSDIDDPAFSVPFNSTEVTNLAASLNQRTTNPSNKQWLGPLMNISDLVGRYVGNNVSGTVATSPQPASTSGTSYYACNIESSGNAWGSSGNTVCYSGYSADLDGDFASGATGSTAIIQRKRQSAIRALATGGQVRVWNLLIDIDAQTGVFPPASTTAAQFTVQGESHYWVHVSIDRYTGQIIDSQSELVQQ